MSGRSLFFFAATLCWFAIPQPSRVRGDETELPLSQKIEQGQATITMTIERQEISVADPFLLNLEVEYPQRMRLKWAQVDQFEGISESPKELGDFTVLETESFGPLPIDPQRDGQAAQPFVAVDRQTTTFVIELETLIAGQRTIPALAMTMQDRSSLDPATYALSTPEITLPIASLLPEESNLADFRDLKPELVISDDPSRVPVGWILLATLSVVATLIAAAWKLRSERVPPLSRSELENAMEEIETASRNQTIGPSEAVSRSTETLKLWIAQTQKLPAMTLATDEILSELKRRSAPESWIADVESVLGQSDEVKFAGAVSSFVSDPNALSTYFGRLRRIVQETPGEVS